MSAPIPASAWATACPDWKDRIRQRRSLIPDLPLFDAVAEKALRIFKRLRVPDMIGKPTYGEVCGEWVFGLVRAIFGSYDPETKRRALREFFLLIPKKNGKSSIAAAIMVTAAIMNERPNAGCLMIAPTKEIAAIAYDQAEGIILADPELGKLFHVQSYKREIVHLITGCEIVVRSAAPDVVTGVKATFILIDETHVFASMAKAKEVFTEIRGALVARPDGFLLQITTQSKTPPTGVFRNELMKARDVRDGKLAYPLLPILYELPPEDAAKDGWRKPETWLMVNPNIGRSVDLTWLEDELRAKDREGPADLALFASQHFNVEIGLGLNAGMWAGALYWPGCTDEKLTFDRMLEVCDVMVVGGDVGGADDLVGLAAIGRHRHSRRWLSWSWAWCVRGVLDLRKSIAPKLLELEAAGDLRITDRAEDHITEAVEICCRIRDAGLFPEKAAIGLDPHGVAALLDELELREFILGEQIVPIGQGYKLNGAIKGVERRLLDGKLQHGGQPLMTWCVGNAKAETRGNNVYVTKEAAGVAKIDPLISLFNAAILMDGNPEAKSEPEYQITIL